MKKIILLAIFAFIEISAFAQEQPVPFMVNKSVPSVLAEKPGSLNEGILPGSMFFASAHSERFTDLYFTGSTIYNTTLSFPTAKEAKIPVGDFNLGRYDTSFPGDANGFLLVKRNNKKAVNLNISLGGQCGL